jgi:hypothetical protein
VQHVAMPIRRQFYNWSSVQEFAHRTSSFESSSTILINCCWFHIAHFVHVLEHLWGFQR